jgi:oligopeptide/dipeptide ABC transporter ATP-binding protein
MMQAQILELLEELRRELGLAMILITHDLSVLAETCDRVAIMYAGQIAETGTVRDVFAAPQHPYTQRLLGAFPTIGGPRELAPAIPGVPPDPSEQLAGCRFAPRCHHVAERCGVEEPQLRPLSSERLVRCHYAPWPVVQEATA